MKEPAVREMITLLEAIDDPLMFDMAGWFSESPSHVEQSINIHPLPVEQRIADIRDCGTSACFAGWTVVHLAPRQLLISHDVQVLARELLDFDTEQTTHMFFSQWGGRISEVLDGDEEEYLFLTAARCAAALRWMLDHEHQLPKFVYTGTRDIENMSSHDLARISDDDLTIVAK